MDGKIKLIQAIPGLGVGGAERLVLDLIKNLDQEKYEIKVVATVCGGEMKDFFEQAGFEVKVFNKKGKLGLAVFYHLYNYFKKEKPDIVHTHLFGADLWAGLAARLAKAPHIVKTEHNVNINEGLLKKLLKRATVFVFERMAAISPAVVEYMIGVEKMPKEKIKLIYNGIDIGRFNARLKDSFNAPPVLINVARFEKQKGHRVLIKALEEIKNREWVMWLVGGGRLRPDIEKAVREAGLEKRVRFFGERNDVPELLAKADIFVFPSLWEGFGLAALEAGAAGLPIIASRVGGIENIFEDNKNAQLVEPGNCQALAGAIKWMIEHPQKALFLGHNARKLVATSYSIETMVAEYDHLYQSVL